MPIDVNSTFKSEKSKSANRPIYLYTIHDYDGLGTNLNFCDYASNVTFSGTTYSRFPIKHEAVPSNSEGQIDAVKVIVSNVSRVIEGYLEEYDLRGKKVTIKLVFVDQIADGDAHLTEEFYIDSYNADQSIVTFSLTSKFDVLSIVLPSRMYMRNHCQWKFKSTQCGYSGGESTCNKTKTRCKELNNYERFGAFPSVPTRRLFVS